MSDEKSARVLLDAAERDVRALAVMGNPDEVSEEVFGFHVQQGGEKLLKAWLALLGGEYPFTHDLEALLDLVGERTEITDEFEGLIGYTPFAVKHRYEGLGQLLRRLTVMTRSAAWTCCLTQFADSWRRPSGPSREAPSLTDESSSPCNGIREHGPADNAPALADPGRVGRWLVLAIGLGKSARSACLVTKIVGRIV